MASLLDDYFVHGTDPLSPFACRTDASNTRSEWLSPTPPIALSPAIR
jgi:hypothetical protein